MLKLNVIDTNSVTHAFHCLYLFFSLSIRRQLHLRPVCFLYLPCAQIIVTTVEITPKWLIAIGYQRASLCIHGTGIFTFIYHKKKQPHVGKYSIHGWYRNYRLAPVCPIPTPPLNFQVLPLLQGAVPALDALRIQQLTQVIRTNLLSLVSKCM